MKFLKFFLFRIFCPLAFCISANAADDSASDSADDVASRVIVVANSVDGDSVSVAEHYMRARGIPEKNLIAFEMPREETISWKIFAEKVHAPLLRELASRGLIDGCVSEAKDDFGRNVLAIPAGFSPDSALAKKNISFLVLCRGVPLRIGNEPEFQTKLPPAKDGEPKPKHGPLEVNNASVDSELALIAIPGTGVNGFVPNPLFKEAGETPLKSLVLKVARLDGPTAADAKNLVESAIKAEKNGLLGRAYIDVGGPHAAGDKWLSETAEIVRKLGFDMTVEKSRALLSATSRYDAPVLYFGWYSAKVGGFFTDPNFRFPAGACAVHIHSFSATTMRNTSVWVPGLVARGVAATLGNVHEPYLGLTHYPHYFAEALAAGMRAGDAAAYALPGLSWQAIFVGDPLYRPFAKTLDEQLTDACERPSHLTQYAFLRARNLAFAQGDEKKAARFENEGTMFAPGLALAFFIEKNRVERTGAPAKWKFTPSDIAASNSGLMLEIARFLAEHGDAETAVRIYKIALERNLISVNVRLAVLCDAIKCAQVHGVSSAPVSEWQKEIDQLGKRTAHGK